MLSKVIRAFSTKSSQAEAEQLLDRHFRTNEMLIWLKRPSERMLLEPRERNLMKAVYVECGLGAVFAAGIIISFFGVFPQVASVVTRLAVLLVILLIFGGGLLHRLFL